MEYSGIKVDPNRDSLFDEHGIKRLKERRKRIGKLEPS